MSRGMLCVYERDKRRRESDESTDGSRWSSRIPFQYNPEEVSRSLSPRRESSSDRGSARSDVLKVSGPPEETINLTIYLDAMDQFPRPGQQPATGERTLVPVLSALEMLLHPTAESIKEGMRKADEGQVQVSSGKVPLTLLVWGEDRVVPVRLTQLGITEQAFDRDLRPIRAQVDLGLEVLTTFELPQGEGQEFEAYVSHLRNKGEEEAK